MGLPAGFRGAQIFSLAKEEYSQAVATIIVGPPANVENAYNSMIATLQKPGLEKLNDYMTSTSLLPAVKRVVE